MASLYDTDFHAWTQEQASKLRKLIAERANVDLDFEHIAEEIESVGKSDRREVASRLETILTHLLKIAYSVAHEPMNGWRGTVRTQRRDLLHLLEQSPSLRGFLDAEFSRRYNAAAEEARLSHIDMTLVPLPSECPWDLDRQILNPDWLPEPRIQ